MITKFASRFSAVSSWMMAEKSVYFIRSVVKYQLMNEIINGKTEKSQKAVERWELQEKVVSLYLKGRANLDLKENNHFNLPVELCIRKGTESLQL